MVIEFEEMLAALRRAWRNARPQYNDPDFDDPSDTVVAAAFLVDARFHMTAMPPYSDMDQGCAEALIAQWYGLDEEEAVEVETTIDLRGGVAVAGGQPFGSNRSLEEGLIQPGYPVIDTDAWSRVMPKT